MVVAAGAIADDDEDDDDAPPPPPPPVADPPRPPVAKSRLSSVTFADGTTASDGARRRDEDGSRREPSPKRIRGGGGAAASAAALRATIDALAARTRALEADVDACELGGVGGGVRAVERLLYEAQVVEVALTDVVVAVDEGGVDAEDDDAELMDVRRAARALAARVTRVSTTASEIAYGSGSEDELAGDAIE